MPKFRLTVTIDYECPEEYYEGCETPADMADVDLTNFRDNPEALFEFMENSLNYSVDVEVR